jgi:hypothetical protein
MEPTSQNPTFEVLSVLSVEELQLVPQSAIVSITSSNNLIAFIMDCTIAIWNFEENTAVTWEVRNQGLLEAYSEVNSL